MAHTVNYGKRCHRIVLYCIKVDGTYQTIAALGGYTKAINYIRGEKGTPAPVQNPQFLTFKNGELVQTQEAIEDPYSGASDGRCYTVDTENYEWSVQCDIGDVIEVRFRCEDEFGLGYDFLFQTWVAEGETAENQASAGGQSGSALLELYWPE